MKKLLATLLSAMLICTALITVLAGCDSGSNGEGGNSAGSSDSSKSVLQLEKRYLYAEDIGSNPTYYIFHADGTGEYVYHYDYFSVDADHPSNNDIRRHYTVHFKYTYADVDNGSVVCFYDSVTYHAENREPEDVRANWARYLSVSENVLVKEESSGFLYYVNEDYARTLTNYHG